MYGGGTGGTGYGVGLGPGPGPHYAPSSSGVSYQLGPPPPPPPAGCPTGGSQLLSYGPNLSPHHIQQTHSDSQQSSKTRSHAGSSSQDHLAPRSTKLTSSVY
ncbi:hypothetical protein M0804_011926 [Polistes exclamans]|nr:hypothetical protein M0804_011926 [Polistes exclamans]